ncbi:MAG: hypothetical protein O7A04_03415 [Acidobacteria bacterium]|nr:hypothetical protein [Acidobacteriota bacterium]
MLTTTTVTSIDDLREVCDREIEIIDAEIAAATRAPKTLADLKAMIRGRRNRWPRLAASVGPSPKKAPTSTYADGVLTIQAEGRNTWTVTGPGAWWIAGVIASARKARGASGEGRVLGRLLNGHYPVVARAVRVSRETAADQRLRELNANPEKDVDLLGALEGFQPKAGK